MNYKIYLTIGKTIKLINHEFLGMSKDKILFLDINTKASAIFDRMDVIEIRPI